MAEGNLPMSNGLDSLINLIGAFKGTNSTSTTKSNVTPQGMNALIQQILGSAQGLSAVASGQKGAGVYNSSTNQLLINDLITRTAGELAKAQAGSTTTTRGTPKVGGQDILTLLLAQSANKLLGPTIKGVGKKLGLDEAGDNIANFLGVGSSGAVSQADATLLDNTIGSGSIGEQFLQSLSNETISSITDSVVSDASSSEGGNAVVDFFSSLFG